MRAERGFTLFELILVIVIGGIIAATLTVFLRPAFDSYLATRNRSSISAEADLALRRMVRDVRAAVPNSIRSPNNQCFELVPTSTGGRLRMASDTVNDSGPGCIPGPICSAPLDTTQLTSSVDVLTPLSAVPAAGDWLVIGNQSPNEVYSGSNRAAISAVSTPDARFGRHRISIAATQFPLGYNGGRFSIVPASQQAVFYVCSGANGLLDASGNGNGTLRRVASYGFNAGFPAGCPAAGSGQLLASGVRSCSFIYDPNQGATQQNGFVYLQIELSRRGETAALALGAHVSNVP